MPSEYSNSLKIQLMATGENAGDWGTITNANLGTAIEQAVVGKADVTMSSTTITLTLTDSNAAQNARALYLNLSGSPGGAADLVVPAIQKSYVVKNGSDAQVTIKVSGQTGVAIPSGKTALVYNNGTDVVTSVDYIPSLTLGAALPVASGGTGITAFGTGVATALGVNTGSAGAFIVNGGALGTPSSGTLTSCTGLPVSTGISGLGANVAAFLASPSSANLAAAVTGETGTGALVFATSPTLVTPTLGVASATSINGVIINRGLNNNNESVAIGPNALDATTSGNFNVAVGDSAGTDITSGTNNSLLGRLAGGDITTGSNNSVVGREAARNLTTGSDNVAVGRDAAKDLETGTKNIHIGLESQVSSISVDREIVIAIQKTGKGNETAFLGGANGVYNEGNTTAWQTSSDARLKKNIVDNTDGLAKIEAIRVRNFEYRAPEEISELPAQSAISKAGVQLGVIAQEMLPECVSETSLGVLSVNTDPLVWYLVNAVKELSAQVKNLQEKLNQQNL